jgi:OOP family OmpA-OmpF porin
MKFRNYTLAIGAALALLSGAASAAEGTGFYVGVDAGQSSFDMKKGEIDSGVAFAIEDVLGLAIVDASSKLDDSDTTYSLFVGYRFLPYLAVEASYLDLGKATYKASGTVTDGESLIDANVNLDWDSKGPTLSVLGILPFADVWDVYARLGVFFADTKANIKLSALGDSGAVDTSKNTTEFLWGVGGGYTFLDNWTVRLEYQMIPNLGDKNETGEFDADRITLGVLYRF